MLGSLVLGLLFGAFCWWLGVLLFSLVIDQEDWSPRAMFWQHFAQALSCLLSVGAFVLGSTFVAPVALATHALIVLYCVFEPQISNFFARIRYRRLEREVRALILAHNPDAKF